MNVLVTGGTGYIGSHTIIDLIDYGYNPICVDNQHNSDLAMIERIESITGKKVSNYSLDLCDLEKTRLIFHENRIDAIIHFAAFKSVGESVFAPLEYYHNNNISLWNLLKLCNEYGVKTFVFSSSCSVYGNAEDLPVTEETPFGEAECPYARTKQIGENMIKDFAIPHPEFKATLLRYFNPAGAHPSAKIGESARNKATNLVPVITETAIGKRDSMTVFGDDYDTRDGSCVRDYIHVMDLARAHTLAIDYIATRMTNQIEVFNLGIGEGVTVLEATSAFEKVSGRKLNYVIGARRQGDVGAIYASIDKAISELDWSPQFTIHDIMDTAWRWEIERSA